MLDNPIFIDIHLQPLRITWGGAFALLVHDKESGRNKFNHKKIKAMSKLLETLVNGSQRIAVTIDGEDLMEFVQAVYEDAHHKAEIAVEKQNSEEFISTEQTKELLKVCDTTLWKWAKRKKLVPRKVGTRNMYCKMDVLAVLKGEK